MVILGLMWVTDAGIELWRCVGYLDENIEIFMVDILGDVGISRSREISKKPLCNFPNLEVPNFKGHFTVKRLQIWSKMWAKIGNHQFLVHIYVIAHHVGVCSRAALTAMCVMCGCIMRVGALGHDAGDVHAPKCALGHDASDVHLGMMHIFAIGPL